MTDALDRLEAAAVHRLREVLASDPAAEPEPAPTHPRRLVRRVLAAAAALAVAVAGVALDLDRDDRPSVMVDQSRPPGPGPGVDQITDAYETLGLDRGPVPPLVVPQTLPDGWRYDGVQQGSNGFTTYITLDFVQESAPSGPPPTVTLCVSASPMRTTCPALGEPVTLAAPGLRAVLDGDLEVLIYGEPDVLGQWDGIRWTLDPTEAAW